VTNPTGKSLNKPLRPDSDHRLKLDFHGSRVTSDAELLAYRELDDALGLTRKNRNYWRRGPSFNQPPYIARRRAISEILASNAATEELSYEADGLASPGGY
jgi:hypothetical protein